jgi:hypothetical protein
VCNVGRVKEQAAHLNFHHVHPFLDWSVTQRPPCLYSARFKHLDVVMQQHINKYLTDIIMSEVYEHKEDIL